MAKFLFFERKIIDYILIIRHVLEKLQVYIQDCKYHLRMHGTVLH